MICPSCQADNVARAERCYACGHALHRAAVGVGSVIASRFELLEELGRGGMGAVYRAHDRALDEVVALKILRPDLGGSAEVALRFRREIKLAWKVRHRNVCAIHEYWEADGLRFISMEFVQGVDLKRSLREQGRLPPREAFDVALQVAKGLEAIHEAGVVHRDLKTMNIMRDRKGVVRLMDFGIAKSLEPEAGPGATQVGQIVGTPDYMSPEQIKGGPLDGRSDLYALGVVVFELFTGELPFRGDTPVATLVKHLHEPPPLQLHARELPPALVPVLERMLAKEPGDRYASAEEVVDALREARHRAFPEAGTSPPGARETVPRPAPPAPVPATVVAPPPPPPPRRPPPPPPPRRPAAPAAGVAAATQLLPTAAPPGAPAPRAAPNTSASMAARPPTAPRPPGPATPLSMAAPPRGAAERPTSASGSFEVEFEAAAPEVFDEEFPEREQPPDFEQEFDVAQRTAPGPLVIPKPGEPPRRRRERPPPKR